MYQKLTFRIVGVAPLIMHSGRGADRFDPIVREIKKLTDKRTKKTDEDAEKICALEWELGLYVENDKVVIPGDNLEAIIRDGAKNAKKGKDVQRGLFIEESAILDFPDKHVPWRNLYNDRAQYVDYRGVKVKGARVMRTRPRFNTWAAEFTVNYLPSVLDKDDVVRAVEVAGQISGACDFRPRYGRFAVDSVVEE